MVVAVSLYELRSTSIGVEEPSTFNLKDTPCGLKEEAAACVSVKVIGNVAVVALSLTLIEKLLAAPLEPTKLILLSADKVAVIPYAAAFIAAIIPAGVSVAVLRVA